LGDLNLVLARIVALRQSIVDDGIQHGVPFQIKDIQTVIERLQSEGSSFVKVTLPLLGKALDQALISGQFYCPANFRLKRNSCLPVFLYSVFNTILDDRGALRFEPSLVSIYFARQFLLFDGKLITKPTIIQEETAYNDFVTRQCLLRDRHVPIGHPVVERARNLLGVALRNLDLSEIVPGHGPGGVAESLDRAERWAFTTWPRRAERWYPHHIYGALSFKALCDTMVPELTEQSVTRATLVPKDFKGPRLISSESAATQYLQQGQMRMMMEYIDRHWLLSRSIRLRDQTHNQRMCRDAYATGASTLDLSNASDNVSAALVWYLFAKVPRLRSQLFSTRSQSIQLGNERVKLASFSPMGSAVCFPVETLVFWSLSLASVRHVHSQWRSSGYGATIPGLRETASCIAVFGDDIIVPDYALQTLIGTLESVGCEVNKSKTCFQTPFRESCGSEWFSNTDVSITRNRRYYYDATRRIINYPVLLDLQRKFFLQGLVRTAALCQQWAREVAPTIVIDIKRFSSALPQYVHPESSYGHLGRYATRCVDEIPGGYHGPGCSDPRGGATAFPSGLDIFVRGSFPFDKYCAGIGWHTSLDSGVRTRYNQDYQRLECRLPTVFQLCRHWPTCVPPDTEQKQKFPLRRGRGRDLYKATLLLLVSGYPRLLARVTGDYVERIAIRGPYRLKMAWSNLPITSAFTDLTG
jgi:hypothetical protein